MMHSVTFHKDDITDKSTLSLPEMISVNQHLQPPEYSEPPVSSHQFYQGTYNKNRKQSKYFIISTDMVEKSSFL